jgi:succinyl-CoA synthetase beta subunit
MPSLPGLPAGPLNEAEAKRLFARFGITPVREAVAATPGEAADLAAGIEGPLVLKALSRHLPHKSELGAVRLGLTAEVVALEAAAMQTRVTAATGRAPEGFLVQERVLGGVEMILGLTRDAHLGPALLLGFGGTAAELLEDTAIRLLPVSRSEVEAMLGELRGRRLLEGFRGAPPADVEALIQAVLGFAAMVDALGERLIEAEINPLFVLPRGAGVRAADGIVMLAGPCG